jgi:hypothetical protein
MRMKRTVETLFLIDDVKAIKIAEKLFCDFYSKVGFFEDKSMPEYGGFKISRRACSP